MRRDLKTPVLQFLISTEPLDTGKILAQKIREDMPKNIDEDDIADVLEELHAEQMLILHYEDLATSSPEKASLANMQRIKKLAGLNNFLVDQITSPELLG